MATQRAPEEELIEISLDGIELGPHDADGLVEGGDPAPLEAKKSAKKGPASPAPIDPAVVDTLRRERDEAATARARAESLVAEERSKREAEQARAEKAEAQAGRSTEFGWRAHYAKVNSDADSIKSALGATQQAIDNDTAALQAASEAGDHAQIAKLNAQIAKNSSYLTRLEEGKAGAEAEIVKAEREYAAYAEAQKAPAKKDDPEPPKKEEQPAPKALSPDEWIGQFPRKTQSWLKEHKDYVTDAGKHQELLGFAKEWADDYGQSTLHTPAFIEALNQKFAPAAEEEEPEVVADEEVIEQPKVQPRKAAASAPVSRNATPAKSSGSMGKIALTRSQYDIAPQIYDKYEDLDPEVKAKFPAWSETAARYQYDRHLQLAKKEKGHRFTS